MEFVVIYFVGEFKCFCVFVMLLRGRKFFVGIIIVCFIISVGLC